MTVRIGCGLVRGGDPRVAAIEAGTDARQALGGAHADLVVVFSSGAHVAHPDATLEGVHEALAPAALLGCGAGGVLGGGVEVEGETGVVVWAAALDGGSAETFHAEGVQVHGLPDADGASAALLVGDPYTFPADRAMARIAAQAPGAPVLGGLASARTPDGEAVLFHDRAVHGAGGVGALLRGVEVLPCVSQGAAPLGPAMTITAAEDHVIRELDGRPALLRLREAIEDLSGDEREAVTGGLLLGVSLGEPAVGREPDYLVRGIIGADPSAGTVTVGAPAEPGRAVRLHVRDAESASRDLHAALGLRHTALGGDPAGALVFTCNGRGRSMFGASGHDADAIDEELGGAPTAGFFAAGEIGPVGGESVLHGFTATIAVFAA